MLTELCAEIRNYFVTEIHEGRFTINGGVIAPFDFIKENQYFRIVGSTFNDGVYKNTPDIKLADETFCGAIWSMAVPSDVVAIATEIDEYNKSDATKPSPYTSESFGGYSYSKATDSKGVPLTWQKFFASRLNKYRRVNIL